MLDANPCRTRSAMQAKRKRDVDVLGSAEVDTLAAKMPAELRVSVVLAAWCGLPFGVRRSPTEVYGKLHSRRSDESIA